MVMKWDYDGREWSARELSEEFGLSENVIRSRLIRSNWTVEQTVTIRVMSPQRVARMGKRKSPWVTHGR